MCNYVFTSNLIFLILGVFMISITSSQDDEAEDKTGKEPFIPMISRPFQSPLFHSAFQSPFQSPFQSLFQTPSLLLNNLRSSATVDSTVSTEHLNIRFWCVSVCINLLGACKMGFSVSSQIITWVQVPHGQWVGCR